MQQITPISYKILLLVFGLLCLPSQVYLFAQAPNELDSLIRQLNDAKAPEERLSLTRQVALHYEQKKAYPKAIEYLKEVQKLEKNLQEDTFFSNSHLANCYMRTADYTAALKMQAQLLQRKDLKPENRLFILQQQLSAEQQLGYTEKALDTSTEILDYYRESGKLIGISNTYNNLGYLSQQLGRKEKALYYYQNAINMKKLLKDYADPNIKGVLYNNAAIAYLNLENENQALLHYQKALEAYKVNNNRSGQAETYNRLAATHYLYGRNKRALDAAEKALQLAEVEQDLDNMLISYDLIAKIYQKQENISDYQDYNLRYQNLKAKIKSQQEQERQANLQKQINIEKEEQAIQKNITQEERQSAALREAALERQRKEQELNLLKKQQELQAAELRNQSLEKERIAQLLALAEAKAKSEKQKREADLQKQEALKNRLIAEKERAESKRKEEALKASRKEKELQQKELEQQRDLLEQEQALKKYGFVIIGLGAVLLAVLLYGFFASQKARKQLEKQNEEITEQSRQIQKQTEEIQVQNEELYQNQEEILAQRDFIEKRNTELEQLNARLVSSEKVLSRAYEKVQTSQKELSEKNKALEERDRQITSSIKSALTIQSAILPYPEKAQRLLQEHFVIYRPKDVVSGDFYWLNEIDGKVILAAVDCTGHGVPGAFMSLIGNTLLDKIVRVWKVTKPHEILTRLHEEVVIVLRQKETSNNNGMDAAIITIEREKEHSLIRFAGAKNPLYYKTAPSESLEILKGDRKAIGGIQNEDKAFTTQHLKLKSGACLYLGSDGLEDQNNSKRRKFGSRRLRKLLEENSHLPMSEQKYLLEQALDEHMGESRQRDDILWIGLRI